MQGKDTTKSTFDQLFNPIRLCQVVSGAFNLPKGIKPDFLLKSFYKTQILDQVMKLQRVRAPSP